MTNEIKIVEHGVMLTDYFHGTSGVWINVSVDNETTLKEIVDILENEINILWDHIEHVAESHNFSGNPHDAIDREIAEIKEYIKGKENKVYDDTLEWNFNEDDLDCELPVLIFTIEFQD